MIFEKSNPYTQIMKFDPTTNKQQHKLVYLHLTWQQHVLLTVKYCHIKIVLHFSSEILPQTKNCLLLLPQNFVGTCVRFYFSHLPEDARVVDSRFRVLLVPDNWLVMH